MDLFELRRPDHVDDAAWRSIEAALKRVVAAWEAEDWPDVIGKVKELAETVAKIVVESVKGHASDRPKFPELIWQAHAALEREVGKGLAANDHLQSIARGARQLVIGLAPLRNDYGTGHGRTRVPDVVEEMVTVSTEAGLVWCRWALRRLGHLLANYPNDLIDAVQSATSHRVLLEKFEKVGLAQQPDDVQERVGVAFGQQSAGGFGNATRVGVDPAINGASKDYPQAYRIGLLTGLLFTSGGWIGLTERTAVRFVELLATLDEVAAQAFLDDASTDVVGSRWIESWRSEADVQPREVVAALRQAAEQLPAPTRTAFTTFCDTLDEVAAAEAPSA